MKEKDVNINKAIEGKIEVDDYVSGGDKAFKVVNETALIKSIDVNNCDFVQYLVTRKELNLDLSNHELIPLFYAIQQKNPEIVQLLLTIKDVNFDIESTNMFKKKNIFHNLGNTCFFQFRNSVSHAHSSPCNEIYL